MTADHPYAKAAGHRLWRRAVAETPAAEVDPVVAFPFRIARDDKVVTAGSCFAQHISRRLKEAGFSFHITEPAHPIIPKETADAFHYGTFSARFGNIYTSRQLLQLIERAYGRFEPKDDVWEQDGRFFDPFRPQIQPGGFASLEEYRHDRRQHLAAVRRAFEELDIFVFTLGLTETWVSQEDGASYPVCPGTAAGVFDPSKHVFLNLTCAEVVADMTAFLERLKEVNPRARTILTVSPVPLVATALNRHVLTSTTYSKSVLRVAAEMLSQTPGVFYFASYEVITGPQARGRYFAEDLRNVTEEGVDHVMRLFFKHVTDGSAPALAAPIEAPDEFLAKSRKVIDALCDEELLDMDPR
jgi:hypothetical protein